MSVLPRPLDQLQLLLTERCNLACTHCAVPEEDSPAPNELDTETWLSFVDEVMSAGVRRLVLSGGEALLRRDCLEIAGHALREGADQVVIVTNGTVFPSTTVERLAALQQSWPQLAVHVSIDGADAPSHDLIRGAGSFVRTMEGIERLRSVGGRIDGMHSVLNRVNSSDIDAMAQLARELGAVSWTVFPLAALGRGVELDALRMSQPEWKLVLERFAGDPPQGLELGLMGPTIGDEWEDDRAVPSPRSVHSPQAVIGPDGAAFTCPPLRYATAGWVTNVVGGDGWTMTDLVLRETMASACPSCKYRPLCTGIDPAAPLLESESGFGEPVGPVAAGVGRGSPVEVRR